MKCLLSQQSDAPAGWVTKEVLVWALQLSKNAIGMERCRSPGEWEASGMFVLYVVF